MDKKYEMDGKGLINSLLELQAVAEGKKDIAKLISIFTKYNLTALDGFALLTEVWAALGDENENAEM